MDLISTCRIINGRADSKVTHDASIYVDNFLRYNASTFGNEMELNTDFNIDDLLSAEHKINEFQTTIKEAIILETGWAINDMQYSLVNAANKSFASIENSLITTVTEGINTLKDTTVAQAKSNAAAIIKHTNDTTAELLSRMDSDTQSILANIRIESETVLDRILQVGCEDLRIKSSGQGNSNSQLAICSQAYLPSPSSTDSLAAAESDKSGGCSAMSASSRGNWSMLIMLLMATLTIWNRSWKKVKIRTLSVSLPIGLLFFSIPIHAQTVPSGESFRSDMVDAVKNMQLYLDATGIAYSKKDIQDGIAALEKVTNEDIEHFFAQLPPNSVGDTIPATSELVQATQALVASVSPQTKPLDHLMLADPTKLTTPDPEFPKPGKDLCVSNASDATLYALTLVNNAFDLIMAFATYVCLQQVPLTCNQATVYICIGFATLQAAANLVFGSYTTCAFVEGAPPTFEALFFITLDIENKFQLLLENSYLNTDKISGQIIGTQDSVVDTNFNAYTKIMEKTRDNIKAAQNYVVANANTSSAEVEYTIGITTLDSLNRANFDIRQNAESLASQIISLAEEKAAAIIAQAKLNADKILDNVKYNANKVLETTRQIGCQNIDAQAQRTIPSTVDICRGRPGF